MDIIHYYWICGNIREGGVDKFKIDTNKLNLGEHKVRASLTIRGEQKPVITDYADFNIIENTSEQTPSQPKIIKTNEEFEASNPKIIADSDTVEKGKDITLRLDTQYERISYYWLFVNPANNEKQISQKKTLTIKTDDLAIGKSPRVRMTITNRQRKQKSPSSYYFEISERQTVSQSERNKLLSCALSPQNHEITQKGEIITFTLNCPDVNVEHYDWKCGEQCQKSLGNTFDVDTTHIEVGKHSISVSVKLKNEATPLLFEASFLNPEPAKNYECKFKKTDKILVVSVDDLDNTEHMEPLTCQVSIDH